jgi:hypothetical protein
MASIQKSNKTPHMHPFLGCQAAHVIGPVRPILIGALGRLKPACCHRHRELCRFMHFVHIFTKSLNRREWTRRRLKASSNLFVRISFVILLWIPGLPFLRNNRESAGHYRATGITVRGSPITKNNGAKPVRFNTSTLLLDIAGWAVYFL